MPDFMPAVQSAHENFDGIASVLLGHYDVHARSLPWRIGPQESRKPDPYRVWLSEIMLQQTTVTAVIPYFEKFTRDWPDFAALAAADEGQVMAAWAGLGYYARARNLIACARAVVTQYDGRMPSDMSALLALPGIGKYTAAAISAIAFGQRAIVVDANVERVVARLYAIATPLPAAKPEIFSAMDQITPQQRSGDFAQAMMDLGASLCSVKSPKCDLCPLASHCSAYVAGQAADYPLKPPKKAKPARTGTAYWIERGDAVWLLQRQTKGMLGGMRALPDDRWSAARDGDATAPIVADWDILNISISHVFTHFSLTLHLAVTALPMDANMAGEGIWWPINSLDKAGLPTLFLKAAKAALTARDGRKSDGTAI